MKNLIFSNLFLLFLTGCSLSQFKSYKQVSEDVISLDNITPWFQEETDHLLFNARIDIRKNHFSGLMVIKYLKNDGYRVIYLTEVGIKIFDMEFFTNGDFKLHYCLEQLNRKPVIKILKNDIGLMLYKIPGNDKIVFLTDKQNGGMLIKSTDHAGIKYYLLNNKKNRVDEIYLRRNLQEKMRIRFFSNDGSELDSVRLVQHNINLVMQLTKLKSANPDVP